MDAATIVSIMIGLWLAILALFVGARNWATRGRPIDGPEAHIDVRSNFSATDVAEIIEDLEKELARTGAISRRYLSGGKVDPLAKARRLRLRIKVLEKRVERWRETAEREGRRAEGYADRIELTRRQLMYLRVLVGRRNRPYSIDLTDEEIVDALSRLLATNLRSTRRSRK